MDRDELITRLRQLAQAALAQNEPEAASILLCLCGALAAKQEGELYDICKVFAQHSVARLKQAQSLHDASRN